MTFVQLLPQCPADTFRVVISYDNYADGQPKGLITAYNKAPALSELDALNKTQLQRGLNAVKC